jgi:hypothetical protein
VAITFIELTGNDNPFNGVTAAGESSVPTFVDVDGDGDRDLVLGGIDAQLEYYRNQGSGNFVQQTGAGNPFAGFDAGSSATATAPAAIDIDGDGDFDLVVGSNYGDLVLLRNDGPGNWTNQSFLPGVAVSRFSVPTAYDIDGDGFDDLVLGNNYGFLYGFRNNGSGSFTELTGPQDRFAGIEVGEFAAPSFFDIDGDGDEDLLVGAYDGTVSVFANANGSFAATQNHPFAGFDFDSIPAFAFVDLDGDGDLDAVVGEESGPLRVFRNTTSTPGGPIEGSPGADTLNGTAGNDAINGLGGDDSIFAQQGGDDQLDGGEGDDGLYFGAAMTSADGANGGAGIDTLGIQGNYPNLVLGAGMIGIEVLLPVPGNDNRFGDNNGAFYDYVVATVDANVAAGATLIVTGGNLRPGEDLTFNGAAETDGNFRLFAGQGLDTLTGGAGSDGFFFGADGNLTGADRVDGGGGIDSVALRGNYFGAGAVVFQDASYANIEVMAFLSGHTNEHGGFINLAGFDYDVTLANGTTAAGQRLDVNATTLRANESLRLDARAEADGSVRILSGAGDDQLFGSAGGDTLYGGLGADAIDGSGGNDIYLYRAVAESTVASRDTLTFAAGDRIDLSFIDGNGGAAGDAFAFIGSAAFSNVAGELRAFDGGGQWIVEGDVNGDGTADLVIAVTTAAPLAATDFAL